MSDGRHFTDYRPKCALNTRNMFMMPGNPETPPANSYEFRQYLLKNGDKIMNMNREEAFQKNMCGPCLINPSTMLPEQTKVVCDTSSCSVFLNDSKGIGQGREYYADGGAPKSKFDERRQNKIPKSCCVEKSDDNQFFPLDGKIPSDFGRHTIPSGGTPYMANDRVYK
jgi:hypothetical protein